MWIRGDGHGIIVAGDGNGIGNDRRALARSERAGELVRLRPAAYLPADEWHALPEWERHQRAAAAVGLGRPDAALVRVTAADFLQLWLPTVRRRGFTIAYDQLRSGSGRRLQVRLPPGRALVASGEVQVVRQRLFAAEIDTIHGVRTTDSHATAVDVACRQGVQAGVIAMEGVLHDEVRAARLLSHRHGGTGARELAAEGRARLRESIERRRGWKGIAGARAALDLASGLSESAAEAWLLMQLLDSELPPPRQQAMFSWDDGRTVYRVDFYYPRKRLVVEFDGDAKYRGRFGATPEETIIAERRREKDLQNHGIEVIRINWDDLRHRRAVPLVRAALRRRRAA